jgi:colanic acid/amylovoran biosynthesis glycosyltransferase
MNTIAQYIAQWLEYSDGFVAAQLARSRHHNVVISRDGWMCLDAFPYRPRHRLYLRGSGPLRPAVLDVQLSAWLKVSGAELVHVHFGWPAPDVLRTVRRGWPYVLSVHGTDVTGFVNEHPDYYAEVIDAVDAVIVPSQFLAGRAAAVGFDSRAISVIPSGVDTSFFTPTPLPDGPPIVAFVGRLVEVKGIDVLLRAWPSILSQVPDATLAVLGYGELDYLLETTDASVTYMRPDSTRRHEQVRDLLRRASVVVTPSRTASNGARESLLLVNLEAAACGRPVVSTAYGGIPEFVDDGVTGLLVPENDDEALAAAIVQVLSDRKLAARLGSAAATHVAHWDVRGCAARVDDLYDSVLSRSRLRAPRAPLAQAGA